MLGKKTSPFITIGGPVGLVLGIVLGALVHGGRAEWLRGLLVVTNPVGTIWMNALRVSVIPLTICLLVVGVCSVPKGRTLGRWASLTFACIVGLLVFAALFTLIGTKFAFAISKPSTIHLPSVATPQIPKSGGTWYEQLVPANFVEALLQGDILSLAILAVLFGLALRTLSDEKRRPIEALFVGVRDAMMAFVHWVVLAIPIGAFALTFGFAVGTGLDVAQSIFQFVVYSSALMLVLAVIVTAIGLFVHRGSASSFLAAVSPLAAVAIGTRSSLASLPTLVESAGDMGLPEPAQDVVLPTCVSLFKMNRTVSSTAKLLFLSAALGIVVSPQAMVVFFGTAFLLSFATPGLPSGGSHITWGAYMAAGIPIEAIVLFDVASPLTDVFKTVLNVLADFVVAVIVSAIVAHRPRGSLAGESQTV
ncbi:MAG TPA: cation:dicarboxylase symporter family transporter [Fimbriimonadaceae bacterium]|nr:cation:dicarboxylase symporter family transporter [Fimbriimonadaceae bacterium]